MSQSISSLFTPRLYPSNVRAAMSLRDSDMALMDAGERGPGIKGVVEDITTERRYLIIGAPCSLTNENGTGCYCDAIAILESDVLRCFSAGVSGLPAPPTASGEEMN